MKKFLFFSAGLAICAFTGLFVLGALSQMVAAMNPYHYSGLRSMEPAAQQHPPLIQSGPGGGVQVRLEGLTAPWAQTAETVAAPIVSWATILLALIVFVVVLPVGLLMMYALWRRIKRSAREEEEHRMMQDLYARSSQMADRLESLETVLLQARQRETAPPTMADRR